MDATQNSILVVAFLTKNGEILEIKKNVRAQFSR